MLEEPRVLLIEDDDVLRAMLVTVLRHQALAVDTALDAEEAVGKVGTCDYAAIIIDADLADGGCETFLTKFREARPEATSFVLVIRDPRSGICFEPDRVSAVVDKPLEITTLATVVRQCSLAVSLPPDPLPCPPAEHGTRWDSTSGPQ